MADVERAERELANSNKKIKVYEEELKKARKEIETLSIVSHCSHPFYFSKNAVLPMICRDSLLDVRTLKTYRLLFLL
jgi:hypothetical protein